MNMEVKDAKKLAKGEARCPGAPTTQEIIANDKNKAPFWATEESYHFIGDEDISIDRYIDPAFAEKEYETLWQRTWQAACREEHIPEVGDYYVYDIGKFSLIITRTAEDEIKAFYNACLHRGTKLKPSCSEGFTKDFKCPFHGWSWNLDGSSKDVPCAWDFPHVKQSELQLPEAKVETLGGFVFVNMNPDAPTLAEYIGPEVMKHFEAWKLEKRYTYCHVEKAFPANWKLTMEAFKEAYHVGDTHPQVQPANGDVNSQYDFWGDHVDRFISTLGVVSPQLYGKVTEQDIIENFTLGDSSAMGGAKPTLKEGETARQVMADMFREMFEKATNSDLSHLSDTELLDTYSYTIFPNLFVFPGISLPMVYRFRPDPKDFRRCIYEVMFMRPLPKDGSIPETAEVERLTDANSFADAEGMDPGFGHILDQDTDNLFAQQEGLETTQKKGITLANYQEVRIRHFEQTVDKYINGEL